jgi:hypothetical protein
MANVGLSWAVDDNGLFARLGSNFAGLPNIGGNDFAMYKFGEHFCGIAKYWRQQFIYK